MDHDDRYLAIRRGRVEWRARNDVLRSSGIELFLLEPGDLKILAFVQVPQFRGGEGSGREAGPWGGDAGQSRGGDMHFCVFRWKAKDGIG